MAGATISECPFAHDRLVEPITPCSVPSATDVWGVEVSIARTSTLGRSSLRLPRRQEPLQAFPPPGPPNASARERQPPGVAVLRPKLHAEVIVGNVPTVLPDQHERWRGHLVRHAEPAGGALDERGLSGAEVAGQADHVTGDQELGQGLGHLAGVLGRLGHDVEGRGHAQNSPSCSSITGSPPAARASSRASAIVAKSARICAMAREASPPPRRTAAGWNVGITMRPRHGNRWPRTFEIATGRSRITRVAKLPSVHTTFGSTRSTCSSRYGEQASSSSGSGSRLPGGRHSTVFVIRTSSRRRPISERRRFRSWPAAPTNGRPCTSSWYPGPSPMNIRSARGLPSANTA